MSRATIDYGIDLGTTNSAIAVLSGVDAEIVKNNDGFDTTPSAVWIDRRDRRYVGRAAKERSELDPGNTCVEFKLRMGTSGAPKIFEATGRRMGPEELSAEVLKSLRNDVAQRTGDELRAAVITVPAAFDLSACDATRRAAELAGLTQTPLLQEPTAAALAYGFQSEADNVFWLVYDFGGGTFDAAVVNVRDGEFTVANHRGDNFLGGKLIDWQIVEELLIPAVAAQRPVTGLGRGNPRWVGAVNKLKLAAEEAKIRLSRDDGADILVDLTDDRGQSFEFEYELRRADVERLTEPYLVRSINLCRKALAEAGLGPGDVERLLLVGGPTLSPYLRERLADPREGLGIALDHSQEPVTVVARGAAIFAGTQRVEYTAPAVPSVAGGYTVELEYQPVGPDTEPFVGGRVGGGDTTGHAIEFVNEQSRPPWRSGRLELGPDGTFATTLWADKGRANVFAIELTDAAGTRRPVEPATLTYTVGVVDTQPPLTHSVGVGLDGNEVEWLLERGTPLPARRRVLLRTTVAISRGQGQGMLRIPLLEGEHRYADRNRRIGRLEVDAAQVPRDVPEGSEVDLTLEIDESRLVVARAYVPILDEEFEHAVTLRTETVPEHAELAAEAATEKRRLAGARDRAVESGDPAALAVLDRVDRERIVADVDGLLGASRVDPDAATTCGKRLLDLKAAVDELEDALEWPELVGEVEEMLRFTTELVVHGGTAEHRRTLADTESAVRLAIAAHDADLLRQRGGNLRDLVLDVLEATGQLQQLAFEDLSAMRGEMRDPAEADRLMAEGRLAAGNGDQMRLRQINAQLRDMLPVPPPPPDPFGDRSSTVRRD
ncbi:Hsp70 family protein [Actinomadura hibisca]|uniref:Hsp70 family protein n=1 Tax=Actinomadura hibisca TaxID=68565 RepID=UPI00082E10BB|nr:Hsp70 family protein [Actinomadura hibisca]